MSDITGVEQLIPAQTIGASYGDALMAAIGVGFVAADTDWSELEGTVVPSPSSRALYDDLFELYGRLYRETKDVVHRLGALAGES